VAIRPFSSTLRSLAESQQQDSSAQQKSQQKQKARVEETNAPPQSPWKVFVQTLKEEIEKNQGWQDNVRQLQGEVDKAADSQALKQARALYEKTRVSLPLGISQWEWMWR
jgi:import inner membrane translocase subunit TIM44